MNTLNSEFNFKLLLPPVLFLKYVIQIVMPQYTTLISNFISQLHVSANPK